MAHALERLEPAPADTSWATYVRGHDDIGWAVSDETAAAVGLNGFAHRRFLNDFYSGRFPYAFARGVRFQENAATGDARITGTAASLCGVEQALELGDEQLLEAAIRRLVLLYALALSYGGVPLLYMGDELALLNDYGFATDLANADDSRWLHRPRLDWATVERRLDPTTLEGRVFADFRRLIEARRSLPELSANATVTPLPLDDAGVLAFARRTPTGRRFLGLANFGVAAAACDARVLGDAGLDQPVDALRPDRRVDPGLGRIPVASLEMLWLVEAR